MKVGLAAKYEENESNFLSDIKGYIEQFKNDFSTILEKDYKEFIVGLLWMANKPPPNERPSKSKSSKKEKSKCVDNNTLLDDAPQKEHKAVRLSDIYDENFGDRTVEFIDRSPLFLTSDLIRDAIYFLGSLGYGNKFKDAENQEPKIYLDRDEDIFLHINNFSDKLFKYISCLKKHSIGSAGQFPEHYKPPEGGIQDFIKETDNYRQELKSLSQLIEVEIDNYKRDQLRIAHKEIWERNSKPDVF